MKVLNMEERVKLKQHIWLYDENTAFINLDHTKTPLKFFNKYSHIELFGEPNKQIVALYELYISVNKINVSL